MLFLNAQVATMATPGDFGIIPDGAILVENDQIIWVGPQSDLPQSARAAQATDLEGRLVTPGLIDCHSHVVFGGNRAAEFEQRLNGASYAEIARAGGGIVSTVNATRAASESELLADALRRVDVMIGEGVTLLEIKSGYGLTIDDELKMLRVARAIGTMRPIKIRTSFLGAHAIPNEYKSRPDAYINDICLPALEAAHASGLVDAVDGFCEGIAFDASQIAQVFDKARVLDIPIKIHAEQLSNIGGAKLAAQYGALSADHLEYATKDDAKAMAASGTVAVILPGAYYTLRETQTPPIQAFRDHDVPMALATDCNPGSSPLTSPLLTMNMGCTLFQMTPYEALAGMTVNAARALGMTDRGKIAAGQRADLCIWDVERPAELAYRMGFNPLHARIFGGEI